MNDSCLTHFSNTAIRSLERELFLTPKPGLVDCQDNGAHQDMDVSTFLASIKALSPFFYRYAEVGWQSSQEKPCVLFDQLRRIGIEAEKAMFTATEGINTHKGANFSFALLLGASGRYLAEKLRSMTPSQGWSAEDSLAVCRLVRSMTAHLLDSDFAQLSESHGLTYGERIFLEYGLKGPRGEASSGFPTLTSKALPFLRQQLAQEDSETALFQLLIYLMTVVEDGNLIHRGGIKAWQAVRQEMAALLAQNLDKAELIQALCNYNQILIARRLSPGGSADMLALTLYLASLEGLL